MSNYDADKHCGGWDKLDKPFPSKSPKAWHPMTISRDAFWA
jgi:hypothetical protein